MTPRPSTVGTNITAATVSTVVRLWVTLLMTPLLAGFRAAPATDPPVAEAYHHSVRGSCRFGPRVVLGFCAIVTGRAAPTSPGSNGFARWLLTVPGAGLEPCSVYLILALSRAVAAH